MNLKIAEETLLKKYTRKEFLKSGLRAACGTGFLLCPRYFVFAQSTSPPAGPHRKEAFFYKKLEKNQVQCQTCPHECLIDSGEKGTCGTKVNSKGTLYSVSYGNPCTVHADPVEKKPLLSSGDSGLFPGCSWLQFNLLELPKLGNRPNNP